MVGVKKKIDELSSGTAIILFTLHAPLQRYVHFSHWREAKMWQWASKRANATAFNTFLCKNKHFSDAQFLTHSICPEPDQHYQHGPKEKNKIVGSMISSCTIQKCIMK